MMLYVWIAVGSGLGGAARHLLSVLLAERFGEQFPWGTLAVNVSGSFLIGALATLLTPEGPLALGPTARHFLLAGLFGGFTTYSSFSLQTLAYVRLGDFARAGLYAGATFLFCFLAVGLGHVLAAGMNALRGP
jgi:CrcB protein